MLDEVSGLTVGRWTGELYKISLKMVNEKNCGETAVLKSKPEEVVHWVKRWVP